MCVFFNGLRLLDKARQLRWSGAASAVTDNNNATDGHDDEGGRW